MSLDNANSFLKEKYRPENIDSQVSNVVVYDLENFYIARALPYCVSLYRLCKISSKKNRDIRIEENRNYKNVFKTERTKMKIKLIQVGFIKMKHQEKKFGNCFTLHETMNKISGK